MNNPDFGLDQRWISNTEPTLGLGVITQVDGRHINIHFPAAGEDRTYATDNCPLSRHRFREGDSIRDHAGNSYTVTGVQDNEGFITYQVADKSQDGLELPESLLDSHIRLSTPVERLFAGQIDKFDRGVLRGRVRDWRNQLGQQRFNGLLGGRVQLLPHQFYIASEIGQRFAPRVLLADEVGLGKTIEAGLILHQQLQTGRASRALIVVPDSLVHQWLVEMLRRFNLSFTLLDENRCSVVEEEPEALGDWGDDEPEFEPENPFESAQLILCPLSFLVDNSERQLQALEADWDLLIVDEAHHLVWSEEEASPEYRCIETLAGIARGLLLLTATPEQLGMESHFARLRLLDPARYHDFAAFVAEEDKYQSLSELMDRLLTEGAADTFASDEALQAPVKEMLGETTVKHWLELLAAAEPEQKAEIQHHQALQLLDQHGTGRVLFRNTRKAVKGFPERKLHRHPLNAPESYQQAMAFSSLDDKLNPEMVLGGNWPAEDSRVAWLVDWLKQHRREKVLVICAHADTAMDLEVHLNLRCGVATAVFHEGLSLVDRDRAAAWFADSEDGAQLLVCSEIGSEGRNFQFASHLVLFDLPFNPDLLEQRIGRLDRIGQKGDVNIHVPYYEHSAQQALLDWYDRGVNAFAEPCMAGQAIASRFAESLQLQLEAGDGDALSKLIDDTAAFARDARQQLEAGRNHLLELNSFDRPVAEALVADVAEYELESPLPEIMEQLFDQFGVEQEDQSDATVILRPGDHMQDSHFPQLPDEGMTASFYRDLALSRDDVAFLSAEHPMVTEAIDQILDGDYGNASLCTLKLKPLPPGTLLLELNYQLSAAAPKALQLNRFLAETGLRLLISQNGKNLAKAISRDNLDKIGQPVPRKTAQEIGRSARGSIEQMLKLAEKAISDRESTLREDVRAKAAEYFDEELVRLNHLAARNPNIRQEEIVAQQRHGEAVLAALGEATLSLDSLRVCLAT